MNYVVAKRYIQTDVKIPQQRGVTSPLPAIVSNSFNGLPVRTLAAATVLSAADGARVLRGDVRLVLRKIGARLIRYTRQMAVE